MGTWVDEQGVTRVDEIKELSYYPLRCAAKFNHPFDAGFREVAPAKYFANARAVLEKCACGRWRRRTISERTHELLTVAYGGGTMLAERGDIRELYAAFVERELERQRLGLEGSQL
jgi:hypothetical protein